MVTARLTSRLMNVARAVGLFITAAMRLAGMPSVSDGTIFTPAARSSASAEAFDEFDTCCVIAEVVPVQVAEYQNGETSENRSLFSTTEAVEAAVLQ